MSGFVKIYDTILDSSIWGEPLAVRVVWITMLAMADREGIVRASSDGVARRANVPLDDAERALLALERPDPRSKSQEHDGRRIERLDGGYLILNYGRYRELRTDDQIAAAVRKRRQRERDSSRDRRDTSQDGVTRPVTSTEAEADTEAEISTNSNSAREGHPVESEWPPEIAAFLRSLRSPVAWEAELRMWLNGGRHIRPTMDDLLAAIHDFTANSEGAPNISRFRGYIQRAVKARQEGPGDGDDLTTRRLSKSVEAVTMWNKLLDAGENTPQGRLWRKEAVLAAVDERGYNAFRAIGGNDRLRSLTTKDQPWARKEFMEAYNAGSGA